MSRSARSPAVTAWPRGRNSARRASACFASIRTARSRPSADARGRGLHWHAYDEGWRLRGIIDTSAPRETFEISLASDGVLRCTRVGYARFAVAGKPTSLAMYWFEGYGGGLWLPFSDASSGAETYGGGRYLYDTIKGADLGIVGSEMLLDFNYAYNPSCAYDERWSCPLSPQENRLPLAVNAGERIPF